MDTPRQFDFFRVWRWTLEMFSLALIACYWGLLFTTAVICWRQYRQHAFPGFTLCLLWLIWAALPRT
jgi:hypothetical protein